MWDRRSLVQFISVDIPSLRIGICRHLGEALNIPYLVPASIWASVLLCFISSLRNLSGYREGKRFRQEHGEPAPPATLTTHLPNGLTAKPLGDPVPVRVNLFETVSSSI
jgi:hypothetical protein